LHLLTLVVVAIIQFSSKQWFETFQIYSQNDISHFFKNLFFIQAWGPLGDGFSFNAPTWSVSVEIVVYFIFFICITTLNRIRNIGLFIFLVGLKKLMDVDYSFMEPVSFLYPCFIYFLGGISVYFSVSIKNRYFQLISLVLSCVLIPNLFRDFVSFGLTQLVLILVSSAAYLDTFPLANSLHRWRIFGELTYSVFLWHVPLQMIILMVMMQFDISHSIAQSPLFLLFFLVLTYSVGYVSYRWIEQPARKFLNNRFMPAQ
jgi:peptidoglycan/LPS O-acetylase OafA/YrhL